MDLQSGVQDIQMCCLPVTLMSGFALLEKILPPPPPPHRPPGPLGEQLIAHMFPSLLTHFSTVTCCGYMML